MRRKNRLWASVAALSLVIVTGCSSSTDTSGTTAVKTLDPDQDVTITWWHGQDADAAKLLDGLVAEYESDHPNVTIRASSGAAVADELLQKLQSGFASDTYPDVSYAFGSWASELGRSQRTLDISTQVAGADSGWEEFPEVARSTATVDGRVIGMPAVVDDLGIIYNTELFDAAGLDYPSPDWTWDDFRSAAKALTKPERNQYGTAYPVSGSEDTVWRFWPQLWQNGGKVLDSDGKPAFNSAEGVAALDYWRQLATQDKSVYLDQNGEKYAPSFYTGNIGMIISGPWVLYDLKERKTPYGVSVLPGTDGDHQTISGPDLWVLLDHDDAQRAAASYDFINWLTSAAQDVRWNVEYGNLPLRSSTAETPEFVAYAKRYPGAQTFFDNLSNATTARPTVPGYTSLSREVGRAISEVLINDADPQEALDKAAETSALDLE
jgi:multiple sugar transport system substrate-binding protein